MFQSGKNVLHLAQRICTPNLALIGAVVRLVLMKQKCDGRKDGRKEGRTEGRRVFHSPSFFNAGDHNWDSCRG